ncbi:cache domain-containing sensor histidine kinase [Cohnella candidum]|uniref:Sensor histidine kinase n=1 Tax=Cohnella candidum TaxID=2674991 RepID=A0A3G3JZV9_9BACL|nr:sensor histidine kinase [Cohnella candidum]AYQ73029.1 sensor histidine kinase [Cohnella candidum]
MIPTLKRMVGRSLRARLLTILLLFSMLGLTLLSLALYWRSSDILIEQEQRHNRLELDQLANNLQAFVTQTDVISKDFAASETVQSVLARSNATGGVDIDEQQAIDRYIGKTVVTHSDWLSSINLFDLHGSSYYEGLGATIIGQEAYKALLASPFYQRMEEGRGKMVVGPLDGDGSHVLVGRIVNRISDFQPAGLLIMHVKVNAVTSYFSASGGSGTSHYALFNPYGNALRSDSDEPSDTRLLKVRDGAETKVEDTKYLLSRADIPGADWTLIKLTSIESIIQGTVVLQQTLLVFGLVSAPVIVLLSIIISDRVSRPLNKLTGLMRKSVEDRFLVKAPTERLDEVGELNRTYNLMMQEINDLINKEYKLNYLNKEMELRSLQAQINPHFIYNTLESINWASRMHGLDDVGRMAESLANLLRISIRDQDKPYRVREEISYVSNYMAIQQYRFEDRVHLELDVPESLYDVRLPKLIIQPLIENAIVHNLDTADRPVHIVFRMRTDESGAFAVVTVADNGGGIPDAIIGGFDREVEGDGFPRGLANVHRRLVLNYGESGGLRIHSSPNGTTIRFKIPMEKEGKQHELQATNL